MKDLRICFVGDSFVNGTGDPTLLGWAGRVCVAAQEQGYEVTYYNLGIRGHTSRQIAQRWHVEVMERLPKGVNGRIVFSFGANDIILEDGKQRIALAESLENTRQMLANAQRLFLTIMVGPPPLLEEDLNQRIGALSRQLASVCGAIEVPYLEVFTPLREVQAWQDEVASNDGAHPRTAGYERLSQLVQEWSAWKAWFV